MDITNPKVAADTLETSVAVAPVLKQEMVAKLYPHRGHQTFKLDRNTGEITPEIPVTTSHYDPAKGNTVKRKIQVKPGFLYVTALNHKNATKKFISMMYSMMQSKASQEAGVARTATECEHQYQRYGGGTTRTCVLCGDERDLSLEI